MTLRDRFRSWLGLSNLEGKVDSLARFCSTANQLAAFESHWNAHKAEIIEVLSRIEKRLIVEHVGQRSSDSIPVLDWESVQRMMLQDMMANPPKE